MIDAYKEGVKALEEGDALFAAKKFNEAEILFPQSKWAPKSLLMAAYSYYTQDYYFDAIYELERFIKIYPKDKRLPIINYSPKPFDLIFFPSSTLHYTVPFSSDEERHCISFDVQPR